MALNDQILDELKKALNKVQATATSRQTWQEQFDRQPSVSPESIQAAKAIEGFVGSWAAQANLVEVGIELLPYVQSTNASEPKLVTSHLGRPGVPEVNFPLYSWGTNKDIEPALLGHPISFSIVGPTLRHKSANWQWIYADIAGVESLTLDSVSFDGGTPTASTLLRAYGISTIPAEGLYLVVSQTGAPAEIDIGGVTNDGGVGDGYASTLGGRQAVTEKSDRASRYEIFRISSFGAPNQLILDSNKKFSDYFNIPAGPATPIVRAVTLFKPFAARMASIPSEAGAGKNKVFLAITPETSANGDLLPAYGDVGVDNTWLGGNFTNYDFSLVGSTTTYGGETKLPVFMPKGSGQGRLQTNRYQTAGGLPFEPGVLKITDHSGSTVTAGDVVHVRKISQFNPDYGILWTVYNEYADRSAGGYYEVLSVVGSTLTCKALPQVDTNGNIFYGPTVMNAAIDLDGVPVAATAGVQIKGVVDATGDTYTLTIANQRNNTSNTYTYVAAAADTAQVIGTALRNQINALPDPNVTAALNVVGANDVTIELTAITAGVGGNAITLEVSPEGVGLTTPSMYKSGEALGTTTDATTSYTGTITPTIGHGIGVNLYRTDLEYTVHDNVSSLWLGQFNAAKVQQNRLTNLIDPTWNKQALSTLQAVTQNPVAVAAGRSDKAIFDTTNGAKGAANPGSLLDLGFRMVLFPAKDDGGGNAVPDYDNPITTQNVLLDPAINESQYLYIDYASGAIVCSHTPDPTNPLCTLAPNGIVGTGGNNPRGDLVLFASCVPFSRQPQQTSGGLRILTTEAVPLPYANTYQEASVGSQDVLGSRQKYTLAPTFSGVALTLASQTLGDVYLIAADTVAPASTQPIANTIQVNTPAAGASLTFYLSSTAYTVTLTAVAGAPVGDQFQIGGSNAATATNLANAINTNTKISQILYAKATGVYVNVYTRQVGASTTLSALFPFAPLITGPFRVLTSNSATLILPGGGTSTFLFSLASQSKFPDSGWFDVIEVDTYEPALKVTDGDDTVRRVSTFWYGGKELVYDSVAASLRTKLKNVFGGAELGNDIDLSAKSYYAVLRKADVLPNDLTGNTGTPYQIDTTEGASARFNTIKFAQGTVFYGADGLQIDLSLDFVKKRGDTMSGSLTISIDTTLNPSEADNTGLTAFGNGSGSGVYGQSGDSGTRGVWGVGAFGSNATGVFGQGSGSGEGVSGIGGTTSLAGAYFNAGTGSNGQGVYGNADGTGAGVYGVNDVFGGTGPGVKGLGRRGVVAESYSIANYPQARLVAQGTAVPAVGNRLKGDLWVPDNAGVDWDGHLLVYDGSNYLDAYASILSTQQLNAQRGGVKLISNYTTAAVASTLAEPSDLAMSASYAITASTGGSMTVVVSAAGHTFVAGDNVYIAGAADTSINNTPPPATKPSNWKVQSVVPAVSFTIIINAVAVGGGAGGTATKVYSHPMQFTSYLQSGGGGNGTLKFEHVYALPKSYKGLSSTASDVAVEFNHRLSGNSAGSTWTIYMSRYRAGANYPVIASVKSGNYATGLFLQSTQVLVSDITASSLGATPFQAEDIVGIFIVASTVLAGCTVYIYEVDFNFCETFFVKY